MSGEPYYCWNDDCTFGVSGEAMMDMNIFNLLMCIETYIPTQLFGKYRSNVYYGAKPSFKGDYELKLASYWSYFNLKKSSDHLSPQIENIFWTYEYFMGRNCPHSEEIKRC